MNKLYIFSVLVFFGGCASSPPRDYYPHDYVHQDEIGKYWKGSLIASETYAKAKNDAYACVSAAYSIDKNGSIISPAVFYVAARGVALDNDALRQDVYRRLKETSYVSVSDMARVLSTNIVIEYFVENGAEDDMDVEMKKKCARVLPDVKPVVTP